MAIHHLIQLSFLSMVALLLSSGLQSFDAHAQSKKSGKGGREKAIIREKIYKGDSRKIDFEATDIGGGIKSPFGSMVNQNKARKEFDLIRPRLEWHQEMKQSTSSLETGRSAD